jgi:hypothetical protein
LISSAKETFGIASKPFKNKKRKVCISSKPWFGADCKFARQHYRKLKQRSKTNKTEETRELMKKAGKDFKKQMDVSITKHRKEKFSNCISKFCILSTSMLFTKSTLYVTSHIFGFSRQASALLLTFSVTIISSLFSPVNHLRIRKEKYVLAQNHGLELIANLRGNITQT